MGKTAAPESSASAASAHNRNGKPPRESPEALRMRRLILFYMWAIVIFLGLPIWWKTTTIYRAQLPLELMEDWSNGKVCRPTFTLRVAVEVATAPASPSFSPLAALAPRDLQHLLKNTQNALHDLNDFSIHHIRLLPSEQPEEIRIEEETDADPESIIAVPDNIALLLRLIPVVNGHKLSSKLHSYSSVLDVFYSPNHIHTEGLSSTSPLAIFIAKELQSVFSEEQATLSYALRTTSQEASQKAISSDLLDDLKRRSTRSFKYAPSYFITFSLITPTSVPTDWEIEVALEKHISPLLASLSSLSDFTMDSQIQLYAGFTPSIKPEYDAVRNVWTLSRDELSGFINAAEWPLNPHIGAGPTINFIIYVPAPDQSPLVVRSSEAEDASDPNKSSSWLIPQWGGVQILNLHTSASEAVHLLTADRLEPAMRTISTQLLSLLGLPRSPTSLPLRISTLARVHAATLIHSASSTVGAMARLTRTLPSMAIPSQAAAAVDRSMAHLTAACASLSGGRFASALEEARSAEREAERAFFERSMVGQAYFPFAHKVLMYGPLYGPSIYLLVASVKEIRKIRELRNAVKND